MTADESTSRNESSGHVPIDENLILELNFVPQWARKEPGAITYPERSRGGAPHERGRRPRRDRPRPQGEGPGRPRRDSREPGRRVERDRSPEAPRGHADRETYASLPVRVRFVPEQHRLAAVVRRIRASRRAYPLDQLASFMLGTADSCYAKIEPMRGQKAVTLFQCRICRTVAMDRDALVSHVAVSHLDEFFDREEVTVDPPAGEFVCVAKCGLSGILLGPPNHHGYARKVHEVHKARYSHMPLEEYRNRIQTLRDAESIEQWKEEYRHQVVYRLKTEGEEKSDPMEAVEAEEYLRRNIAASHVVRVKSASVPLDVARSIEDPAFRSAVLTEWARENRFPRFVMFAMKAAFTHMRLYIFRAGRNHDFVTSVKPVALDPEHTIESIKETLVFLHEHPGCKRNQLVRGLRPDVEPNDPSVDEILSPLGWLIEKGHIIEFFDGSLSVPLGASGNSR